MKVLTEHELSQVSGGVIGPIATWAARWAAKQVGIAISRVLFPD